jgi:hypothetical protein
VEHCAVAEPTSTDPIPDTVTAGKWRAIANPVEGLGHELGCLHTCSWVVSDLPYAKWVTFRVRVSNCSAYAEWSMPSQAQLVKSQAGTLHPKVLVPSSALI